MGESGKKLLELTALRQSLGDEDDVEAYEKFPEGGDRFLWIHTPTMVADCLTKHMKPYLLLLVLCTRRHRLHQVVKLFVFVHSVTCVFAGP